MPEDEKKTAEGAVPEGGCAFIPKGCDSQASQQNMSRRAATGK
jgi:hypothetical protein